MARAEIHLNHAGIAAILKSSAMQSAVHDAAEVIAGHAGGIMVENGTEELPVLVEDRITDRAETTVVLAHAAGLAAQAKYGVLTGGAGRGGYQVTG